jgi:hypothetical protein
MTRQISRPRDMRTEAQVREIEKQAGNILDIVFKIHQTGTATIPAKDHVVISFPDLGYRPACLAYMLGTEPPVANQAILAYYVYFEEGGAYSWGIWASTTSNSIRIENFYSHSLDIRYYVLKEEAI